jgi:hypothetical protein
MSLLIIVVLSGTSSLSFWLIIIVLSLSLSLGLSLEISLLIGLSWGLFNWSLLEVQELSTLGLQSNVVVILGLQCRALLGLILSEVLLGFHDLELLFLELFLVDGAGSGGLHFSLLDLEFTSTFLVVVLKGELGRRWGLHGHLNLFSLLLSLRLLVGLLDLIVFLILRPKIFNYLNT